ncbi:outer membrane protein assembly factor BamD [Ferruginibacter sp. SUN002]|uniref:outer membrane protein assembly factor BamD n=1 Tax=Ferruginibacter sp. SUN002 TaxID=2937789 RepID=UPI003D35AC25
MKFSSILFSIVFFALVFTSCSKYSKVQKSNDYAYKLEMADKYFDEKKYRIAQELYEELYPVYKGTDKFEKIYYKDAYCFYYLKNYRDAENFFKGFLEVFPNSEKSEEVDFMHALCFFKQSPKIELDQTSTAKAIGVMQTFISMHPNSPRIAEATAIIDQCRAKLELKEARAAELYYKVGQYRAAALAFTTVLNDYPESSKGDEYKLKTIKSYYHFSKLSITEKQIERFEKVISEYQDFADRYPESSLLKEAEEYSNLSKNYIKEIQNEQAKTPTKL